MWLPVSRRCSWPVAEGPLSEAPPSKHPGAARRSRSLIPAKPPKAPPSKHLGAARRSLLAATLGSSHLSMRLGLWSGWVGKTRRNAIAKKSAAKPNPNRMRKKRKERRSADGPYPEKSRTDRRLRIPPRLTIVTSHAHTPAAPEPLQRGGGDLGSHTSPQSSWSEFGPTCSLSITFLDCPMLCQPHFDDLLRLLLTSPRSQDGECSWVRVPILALHRLVKSFGLLR